MANDQTNTGASTPPVQAGAADVSAAAVPATSSSMIWIVSAVVGLLIVGGAGAYFFTQKSGPAAPEGKLVRIGLSLDSVKIQRWADERDIMIEEANKQGAVVTVFSAENDDATQIAQIENLISQKVDVIIVIAHNSAAVGPVLTKAQQEGIKVIDYDRLTANDVADLYLSFDSVKVGNNAVKYVIDAIDPSIQVPSIAFVGGSDADNNGHFVHDGAMQVLEPLVKAGKIKLVYSEYTRDWNPSTAYTNIKKLLDSGVHVDGIAVGNDGMANGVIQALAEHGLAGKVPVSGQDGELEAIKRVVAGTQIVSSWKPGRPLAERAIKAAIQFARGEQPETNGSINNGTGDVKAYLFDPIPVTKENVDETIIKSGTFTREQVYPAQQ